MSSVALKTINWDETTAMQCLMTALRAYTARHDPTASDMIKSWVVNCQMAASRGTLPPIPPTDAVYQYIALNDDMVLDISAPEHWLPDQLARLALRYRDTLLSLMDKDPLIANLVAKFYRELGNLRVKANGLEV